MEKTSLQDYYSHYDSAGVRILKSGDGFHSNQNDNKEKEMELLAINTLTNGPVYITKEEAKKLKEIVDKFLQE